MAANGISDGEGSGKRDQLDVGKNLRRDRYIRDRLRNGAPPWQVIELRAPDLAQGEALVRELSEG